MCRAFEAKAKVNQLRPVLELGLRGGEGGATRCDRESFDVRLPLRGELEEFHAVPFCAVDEHCEFKIDVYA